MADTTPGGKSAFELVLGKATDKFALWQQMPAWLLGLAAILGGAALIAFPKHLNAQQSRDAWVAVIIALFLAVLLSYRSAFTLNEDKPGDQQAAGDVSGQGPGPAQPQAPAGGQQAAGDQPVAPNQHA
jgi:hypothetical protein